MDTDVRDSGVRDGHRCYLYCGPALRKDASTLRLEYVKVLTVGGYVKVLTVGGYVKVLKVEGYLKVLTVGGYVKVLTVGGYVKVPTVGGYVLRRPDLLSSHRVPGLIRDPLYVFLTK